MTRHLSLKREIVEICRFLARKDYVSAMDGNVSVRIGEDRFLTTPTMVHKAFIREDDLVVVNGRGEKIGGCEARHPTSEVFMHLAAYRRRPEIRAVVHAHPPTAVAFTVAGETLARCVLPEVVLTLGQIPTAPYETTGTQALADRVGEMLSTFDALIMERHGVITIGRDLIDAFGKMEKVEHTALITWRARTLGGVRELDCDEVSRLRELGKKYSSRGQAPPPCEGCGGCPSGIPWQDNPSFPIGRMAFHVSGDEPASPAKACSSGLESIVMEEVVRALGPSRGSGQS